MDRRRGNMRTASPSTPQNASGSTSFGNAPLTPSTGSLRARRFPSPRAAVRTDGLQQQQQQQQRHQSGSAASAAGGGNGTTSGGLNSPSRSLRRVSSTQEIHISSPSLPPLQHSQQGDPIVSLLGHQSSGSFGDVVSNASPTLHSPTSAVPYHTSKDSMTMQDFYSMYPPSVQQQSLQRGVTVIYPQTCSPVDPYARGPDYGSAPAVSVTEEDANEDRVQVRVEGFFESNNIGVLIPNDLPPSTLLYVLTASDGRDLMFKLIQYSLQLIICFLKTPTLFSPGVQALMGPLAERLYRNYNTIRHGRSLFKMGRGLLNLFTVQTVCERMYAKYEGGVARAAGAVMLPVVTRLERAVMLVLGVSPMWGHLCSARLLRWVQAAQLTPGQSRRDDVEDSAALDWRIQQRIRDQQLKQQQSAAAAAAGAVQGTLLSDDMYTHVSAVERAAQSSTANVAQLAGSSATGLKHGSPSGGLGFTLRKVADYAGAIRGDMDGFPQSSQPAFPYAAGDDSRTNTSAEHSDQPTPTTGVPAAVFAAAAPPLDGLDAESAMISIRLPVLPRDDAVHSGDEPPRHLNDTPDVVNTAAPTPHAASRSRGTGRPFATTPPPETLANAHAVTGALPPPPPQQQQQRHGLALTSPSSAPVPAHPFGVSAAMQRTAVGGIGSTGTAAGATATAAREGMEIGAGTGTASTMPSGPSTAAAALLTADWAMDGSSRTTLLHPIKRPSHHNTPMFTGNSSMTVDDLHVGADNSVTRDGIQNSLTMLPGAAQSSSYGSMLGSNGLPDMASGGGLMPGEGPLSVPNNWHAACAPTVPPSQSDEAVGGPPTLPFPPADTVASLKHTSSFSTAAAKLAGAVGVVDTVTAANASASDESSDPSVSSQPPQPSSLPSAVYAGGLRRDTVTPALQWVAVASAQSNGTNHTSNAPLVSESSTDDTFAAEGPPIHSTDTAVHASVHPAMRLGMAGAAAAAATLFNSTSHNRCPAFECTEAHAPNGGPARTQGSAAAAAAGAVAATSAPATAAPPNSVASGAVDTVHGPPLTSAKAFNESDMSILSSSTSSSFHVRQGGAAGALSTWLKELQPASAALPARWRKGPLQFNTLLMTLLGVRNLAAACRRFLRDASRVSSERFGTFSALESHRPLITRIINRCWLLVSIIDLLLNTARLLQPGWVKYATARQNIHCRCGCQGDDDPADMVWRTHGFIARRKTDLFFPPLDLDYGAPFVSSMASVEAADPAKLMPACSRCGFLYREVPSESDEEVDDVDGVATAAAAAARSAAAGLAATTPPPAQQRHHLTGTTSFAEDPYRSAHHSHHNGRSAGISLGTTGSLEREKPRWVQVYDEEVLLGESQQQQQQQQRLRTPGGGRRETQKPTTVVSGEAGSLVSPAPELNQHQSNSTIVDAAAGDGLPTTAEETRLQRRKGGAGAQQPAELPTGILFVPWMMRKFFDYVWLLRVHPNLTSTVLLEARYVAELYLAYKYCFGSFETFTADAPLSAILNPYGALAGMVSAAVGLLRVVQSAPSS